MVVHILQYKIQEVHQVQTLDYTQGVAFSQYCADNISLNYSFSCGPVFLMHFFVSLALQTLRRLIFKEWKAQNRLKNMNYTSETVALGCCVDQCGGSFIFFNKKTVRRADDYQMLDANVLLEVNDSNHPTFARAFSLGIC